MIPNRLVVIADMSLKYQANVLLNTEEGYLCKKYCIGTIYISTIETDSVGNRCAEKYNFQYQYPDQICKSCHEIVTPEKVQVQLPVHNLKVLDMPSQFD